MRMLEGLRPGDSAEVSLRFLSEELRDDDDEVCVGGRAGSEALEADACASGGSGGSGACRLGGIWA